nr:hypothetical protein [uncultured Roseateles sp.]
MDTEDYFERLLPHRLNAVAIMVLMLEFHLKWEEPKPMQILVDGRAQFTGLTTMFTNPIIESGALHCRALLEFLGLKAAAGKLVQMKASERHADDAGIEFLWGPCGQLKMLTPEVAGCIYASDPAAGKAALCAIILAAHKGMAHSSRTYFDAPIQAFEALLAGKLVQGLIEQHVYAPLGRARPPVPIEAQRRT